MVFKLRGKGMVLLFAIDRINDGIEDCIKEWYFLGNNDMIYLFEECYCPCCGSEGEENAMDGANEYCKVGDTV